MYKHYNANPTGKQVGDCTVRAISVITDRDWTETYVNLMIEGLKLCDMPSANNVWGSYLRSCGFKRKALPEICSECYTVKDFCREYPKGKYLLALNGHVVPVINGDYYDTWDSGNENPIYYWERKE